MTDVPLYLGIMGSISFLVAGTRPDLAFPVSMLSFQRPTENITPLGCPPGSPPPGIFPKSFLERCRRETGPGMKTGPGMDNGCGMKTAGMKSDSGKNVGLARYTDLNFASDPDTQKIRGRIRRVAQQGSYCMEFKTPTDRRQIEYRGGVYGIVIHYITPGMNQSKPVGNTIRGPFSRRWLRDVV